MTWPETEQLFETARAYPDLLKRRGKDGAYGVPRGLASCTDEDLVLATLGLSRWYRDEITLGIPRPADYVGLPHVTCTDAAGRLHTVVTPRWAYLVRVYGVVPYLEVARRMSAEERTQLEQVHLLCPGRALEAVYAVLEDARVRLGVT